MCRWRDASNEPVEVVLRPEDLTITTPDKGKLVVTVDTQLFRGVHYEIICYDEQQNEWMVHSTKKAKEGSKVGLPLSQKISMSCVSTSLKKNSMHVLTATKNRGDKNENNAQDLFRPLYFVARFIRDRACINDHLSIFF